MKYADEIEELLIWLALIVRGAKDNAGEDHFTLEWHLLSLYHDPVYVFTIMIIGGGPVSLVEGPFKISTTSRPTRKFLHQNSK